MENQNNLEFLNKFAINLTEQLKDDANSPIIGRDEEIRNVIRILSRKSKNNPVLIGEPGVGKTAVVEGIAQRIIMDDVPAHLKNKQIYSLDLGSLVAGAKFQGEFEERLKGVMNEVKDNNDKILLFIDEIHMLIGAGKTSGAMDAANLLKPMLARGELNCIGATTLAEYRENIEKDSAFERRFQKVMVNEPTKHEALTILRGIKGTFEMYHGVQIKDEALSAAVDASSRYINDRFLPDKAIDLVDEACANLNVQLNSEPEELEKLNREVVTLEIEKKAVKGSKDKERIKEIDKELEDKKAKAKELSNQWNEQKEILQNYTQLKTQLVQAKNDLATYKKNLQYEKAAELEYATIPELDKKLSTMQQHVEGGKLVDDIVDAKDILKIVAQLTHIPLERLTESNRKKLLNLQSELNEHVFGQEEATEAVSQAILRNRVNLSDPNRPIGSFLFLGPTGVGKTEVAKTVALNLFNDENQMFRLDMSEFMEKHAVSRLIGSPPGYIGYEEGGELTEYVRRNPYSVILFDEIEKAHPDVLNILLQILDEGHVKDAQGNKINMKNTIIILTSNLGALEILDGTFKDDDDVLKMLQTRLKPELINRIDSIVKFNPLSKESCIEIINKELRKLEGRMKEQDRELNWGEDVLDYIYEQAYVPEFGARPFKRYVQSHIETELAVKILEKESQVYDISIKDDKIEIQAK